MYWLWNESLVVTMTSRAWPCRHLVEIRERRTIDADEGLRVLDTLRVDVAQPDELDDVRVSLADPAAHMPVARSPVPTMAYRCVPGGVCANASAPRSDVAATTPPVVFTKSRLFTRFCSDISRLRTDSYRLLDSKTPGLEDSLDSTDSWTLGPDS